MEGAEGAGECFFGEHLGAGWDLRYGCAEGGRSCGGCGDRSWDFG